MTAHNRIDGLRVCRSEQLRESYTTLRHRSGLEILVFPKKLTTTHALLATRYGSMDDRWIPAGKETVLTAPAGTAHYLEHQLFTQADGSDSFERFSALGADANAYTAFRRTVYLFSCTENWEKALTELLDFVTHPYFTEESVEKERGIIAQEIRMYEDSPMDRCFSALLRALYAEPSVRQNICGTLSSIRAITPQVLYDCYHAFYVLSNMTLVVCGDVTAEQVLRVADAVLPQTSDEIAVRRVTAFDREPDTVCRQRVEQSMPVSRPQFYIGIKDPAVLPTPADRMKREAVMGILHDLLFSNSGPLYNALYEEGLVAPNLSYGYSRTGPLAFQAIAGESDDPDRVFARLREEIQTRQRWLDTDSGRAIPREDFERCKRVSYAEYVKDFDSAEDIANNLLTFHLEGYELFDYADVLAGVTYEEVCAALRDFWVDGRAALSVIRPDGSVADETI